MYIETRENFVEQQAERARTLFRSHGHTCQIDNGYGLKATTTHAARRESGVT